MKVQLYRDELYPVYYLGEDYGLDVDLPEELIERLQVTEKEFDAVQEQVHLLYKEQVETNRNLLEDKWNEKSNTIK
jgi:hypothetical protein